MNRKVDDAALRVPVSTSRRLRGNAASPHRLVRLAANALSNNYFVVSFCFLFFVFLPPERKRGKGKEDES